jgi:hypothetical protein
MCVSACGLSEGYRFVTTRAKWKTWKHAHHGHHGVPLQKDRQLEFIHTGVVRLALIAVRSLVE